MQSLNQPDVSTSDNNLLSVHRIIWCAPIKYFQLQFIFLKCPLTFSLPYMTEISVVIRQWT